MTDKLESKISRAARASALLNDGLLKEAFELLEKEYITAWKEAFGPRDTDARERMWHAIQVLGKVQGHLQKAINDGKIARAQLDELTGAKKKLSVV